MTEQEWLISTDPILMLNFLGGKVSDRKLRLFACACCRLVWDKLDERGRMLVDLAERQAEGLVSKKERRSILGRLGDAWTFWGSPACACKNSGYWAAHRTYSVVTQEIADSTPSSPKGTSFVDGCGLLRDIFGCFFRRLIIPRSWLFWNDRTIPRLAQAIYDDRAFDRLPILADALEESGCTNADILNHCRQPGEHVRGCWVVDLLLGKS